MSLCYTGFGRMLHVLDGRSTAFVAPGCPPLSCAVLFEAEVYRRSCRTPQNLTEVKPEWSFKRRLRVVLLVKDHSPGR